MAGISPASPATEDPSELFHAFQMEGLDRFVADQARAMLADGLREKLPQWVGESLKELAFAEGAAAKRSPDLQRSEKLKRAIQKKLEAWIPKQVKKILHKGLFPGEFKEIEAEVLKSLRMSFNDQADRWLHHWYDRLLKEIGPGGAIPPQASAWLADPLGKLIGQAVPKGFQSAVLQSLKGEVPEEVIRYLKMGKGMLPAAQFAKLKKKVEELHVVNLPNRVYGGILASQVSIHLAKAFAGPKVNFYELKRAKEVAETLVWQLKNREYVSLNAADFLGMIRELEKNLGEFQFGNMKKVAQWRPTERLLKQLNRLEGKLKEIDKAYDKATGTVLDSYRKVLSDLGGEWKKISARLLKPLKLPLPCILPEGCPEMGVELPKGIFGKWGEKSPLKIISSGLSSAVVKGAEALKITGPLAQILEIEKIPPKNPSLSSDFDPVFLHNGEYYNATTDLTVPSEGLPFRFTRIYRSRSKFLGALGRNWTHNFASALKPWAGPEGEGLTYIDPEGKKYFFRRTRGKGYAGPAGLFGELSETPEGHALKFPGGQIHFFNAQGRLEKRTDGKGRALTCFYDEAERLARVEDSQGRPYFFFYRPDGLLGKLSDFSGRTFRFEYDDRARLVAATTPGTPAFPEGKTTRYHYEDDKLTLIMDPKGQIYLQNVYGWEGPNSGKIVSQRYGDEAFFLEARYDGKKTWVKDRRDAFHLYEHDGEGHLLAHGILKKDGTWKRLDSHAYDDLGLVQNISAPPETETPSPGAEGKRYEFDIWGNVIAEIAPDGKSRRFKVDASNLITEENRDGKIYKYNYDANDNIIGIETPDKNLRLAFEYDILDRMTKKKEILSGREIITRLEYDPQGRLVRYVYPLGNDIRFEYDEEGNLVAPSPFPLPMGERVRERGAMETTFDPLGRPLRIGNAILEWDDNSRLISLSDHKKGETFYEYDNRNRLVLEKFPGGAQRRWIYDTAGLLAGMVDPMGRAQEYFYDEDGLLTERRFPGGAQKFVYDDQKRLIEALEGSVRVQFAYDTSSRLAGEAINGRWVIKNYDAAGNKTGIQYPSGLQVVRRFDATRNLLEVFAKERPIARWKYSEEGRPVKILWGNGVQLAQDFEEEGRLSAQTFLLPEKEISPAFRYSYDSVERLIKFEELHSKTAQTFSYDAEGQWMADFKEGVVVQRDTAGNLISDGTYFYDYDPLNRLTAIRQGEKILIRYEYDPFGRVVRSFSPADQKEISFFYDDWDRVEAQEKNGEVRDFIFGDGMDQVLAALEPKTPSPEILFYHFDRLSVRFLTDEKGEMVESYAYDPAGNFLSKSLVKNDLGFLGRPFEALTGVTQLRRRFYSPRLGEFLTADPLGYKNSFFAPPTVVTPTNFSYHQGQGGASRAGVPNRVGEGENIAILDIDLFFQNPPETPAVPELDLFAYAGGDPVNYFDPLGLYRVEVLLPHYGQRDHYGLLNLYQESGEFVTGPFRVLGRSAGGGKKNKDRNPLHVKGDTPSGTYEAGHIVWKKDKKRYGPNPVIPLLPVEGQALEAYKNRRRGLLIHGGRDGRKTKFGDNLAPTLGCVRMHDKDIARLIQEINTLKESGDAKGTVEIREGNVEVISP